MKVKELIEKLKSFDPNTTVVVRGFDEEGYAHIECIEMVEVVPRKSKSSIEIFGEYRRPGHKDKKTLKALLVDHS